MSNPAEAQFILVGIMSEEASKLHHRYITFGLNGIHDRNALQHFNHAEPQLRLL